MKRHSWRSALVALMIPLAFAACEEDPSDPDGDGDGDDRNGVWAFTEDGITSYVRITDDAIEIFNGTGVCFLEIELGIESRDGDTFVVDTGGATVEWTVEEVGSNIVVEDDEGVSRTLTPSNVNVTNLIQCEPFDPEVDDFTRPACATLPLLNVPGSVTGDIQPGDARFYDDTWYDLYRITLTEETDVSITMAADDQDDLNAYLSIYDAAGGEVDDNDAFGQGEDARVEATLGPGCYYVVAGSWSGIEGEGPGGGYTLTADDEFAFVFPPAACTALPEIEVGGSIDSDLVDGDLLWSDGTWYEAYSLQLAAEQTVTITQTADDTDLLDPYLLLFDAEGVTEVDSNDDIDYDGGNYNSQIADITLAPGCYIIVAGTWMGDDEGEVGGDYTLEVDGAPVD